MRVSTSASAMRNPILPVCLVVTVLTGALRAQKVVDNLNENAPVTYYATAADYFCIKRPFTAPLVLTALEYRLSGTTAANVDVGVWDEDPVTLKPRALLGSGTATLTANVPDWYGATFSAPILILAAGNYFVGVKMVAGVKVGLTTSGTVTPHYFSPTTGWNGPFANYGWPFRLYANTHNGAYASYGTGQAGTGPLVPVLRGLGWPNTTNTIGIQASQGLLGAPGVFLLGFRITLPIQIGTIYAYPTVTIPVTLAGTAPAPGYATLALTVPNDPGLNGAQLSTQAWILDAGSATGFAHTGGIEITVGH